MSKYLKFSFLTFIIIVTLSACGGTSEPTGTPAPTATPLPTFAFIAPTNPPAFSATSVSSDAETTPDTQLIDRGQGRYEALGCATCHGENGEGTDNAQALTSIELSSADFISFMRSGGSIGAEHQFSTNRLSENGAQNLYLYLISLADSE